MSTHRIASPWQTSSEALSAQASAFDATKRIVRPNGEVRYIRCVGAPIVENESLKKYVGSALDVTEQELVTQELRRREAYLADAQKLSHTGSFGWKPDDGELVWSDETYRIFEYGQHGKANSGRGVAAHTSRRIGPLYGK